MKKVINRRFLIGLIVATIVLGAAVHGLHAIQINRQSGFLLEKAQNAKKGKEFDLALNYFQQYGVLAPGDMDAKTEFGLLLADRHQWQAAAVTLEKVLLDRPDRDDLRRRVVEVEMEIHRYRDAADHLNHLLKTLPNDAELLQSNGFCQIKLANYGGAATSLRESIKQDPHRIEAYALLADVLRQHPELGRGVRGEGQEPPDRLSEADAVTHDLTAANPKSARAHLLRGQYLATAADLEHPVTAKAEQDALQEAKQAIELDPKDVSALLLAARLLSKKHDYEQAAALAQSAIDAIPNLADSYLIRADIDHCAGNRKKAIACLRDGVKAVKPTSGPLLWFLGSLQIEAGQPAAAQAIIDQLKKLPVDNHPEMQRLEPRIAYLQAQIEVANQHWQKAVEGFEQAAAAISDSPELVKEARRQVAICQHQLGNTDLELAAFREASRLDPNWLPARLGVANTLLSLGKFEEALDEFRLISRLDGMKQIGDEGVASVLIYKNKRATTKNRDWKEVQEILERLSAADPKSPTIATLWAESLEDQGKAPEAEEHLLAARTQSPDQIAPWAALVKLAAREQHWDQADKYLSEADAKFGDRVWLRLARGECLVARYKKDSVSRLKPLAENARQFSDSDRFELYRRLAILMNEASDVEEAERLARQACDAAPKSVEPRVFLLNLGLADQNREVVEQSLAEIRALEGEGPFWHYGQAALCLLGNASPAPAVVESAMQHLGAARKLAPGLAQVPRLTAQIQDHQGRADAALQNYLLAIELGEHNPQTIRRAVELLHSKQQFKEAERLLDDLDQNSSLFSTDFGRTASDISARLENLDRSLEIAQRAAANSKDWRDHLWLGQIAGRVGFRAKAAGKMEEAAQDLAQAEKSLRMANQLEPKSPVPWIVLVQFLAASDRKPDAEALIKQAKEKVPAKTADLTLAACYEVIGDADKAATQYQAGLAKADGDPLVVRSAAEFYVRTGKLANAEEQLQTLASGRLDVKPDDLAWARRTLAAVWRASGSYRKTEQGLALLAKNLSAGNSPDDRREKALELASFPEQERRSEAVRLFEELLPIEPADDAGRIVLAKLYLARNDWQKASDQFRHLVTSHDNDPKFIALYVSQLLEHQETAEAELWLNRLDQLAPLELSTATLRAQAQAQRGQIGDAIKTIEKYLAQPLPAAKLDTVVEMAAASVEALARSSTGADKQAEPKLLAEAETLYRRYDKSQPTRPLVLAMFLMRSHRFDEATSIVETAAPTTDPAALAEACVALLGSGSGVTAQDERVEKLLLAAAQRQQKAEKPKDVASLLLALADLRIRQRRTDDAVAIYRGVLGNRPDNVVALNNMSMLLAGQKKQPEESLELIDRAIALAGPLPALLDSRGSIYLALGKPQEALADLDQAVDEEPRPNRQLHRALACFALGQTEAATKAFAAARKQGLDPNQLGVTDLRDYQQLAVKLGK